MQRRKLINYIVISLKGMAMGAADVVPGVSGGTSAFISGIYEELLSSISSINFTTLKLLKTNGIKAAWKAARLSHLNLIVYKMVYFSHRRIPVMTGIRILLKNRKFSFQIQ